MVFQASEIERLNASIFAGSVRRSPMYLSQHSGINTENIRTADLLENNFKSRSVIRRKCYKLKFDMIVSPMKDFLSCTVAGFLCNLPIMGSIIIVYEKYSQDSLKYSKAMLPIIFLLAFVLSIIACTIFALGVDLLDKGCLAWHRDSLGYLLQALTVCICILVTAVNLMNYIE